MRRRITANFLKALLLVGFLAALSGGLGWLLGGQRTAALFAFCALAAAIAVYWLGDRALLGMLGARPFALAEDPLLRSSVDRVAAQLGITPPRLCLIDDGFPRAFVVGHGPGGATLAVSSCTRCPTSSASCTSGKESPQRRARRDFSTAMRIGSVRCH